MVTLLSNIAKYVKGNECPITIIIVIVYSIYYKFVRIIKIIWSWSSVSVLDRCGTFELLTYIGRFSYFMHFMLLCWPFLGSFLRLIKEEPIRI